ncbi:MAG: elongation factor Ts [Candidatus Pacebacteria bacterium]|nr:elongation factor Ts [Candidatus Paceibacterota bacterium]NUQ57580.1 elongation factor Ts [Candidatus Paceibacter sp.]
MVTAEQIKALRKKTGISVALCKKALEQAGGDMAKAEEILLKDSARSAEKKSDRQLGAGVVEAYVHNNKQIGVMLELKSESDFVSGNEGFRALAKDIAMHATACGPADLNELLSQPYIKNPEITIKDLINQAIQKFGEKVEISRFVRYSLV